DSPAVRMRPVTTSPALKPAIRSTDDNATRLSMCLGNGNATGASSGSFRERQCQDPVFQIGCHGVDVDRFGQRKSTREASVPALDAMNLLTGNLAARRRCATA